MAGAMSNVEDDGRGWRNQLVANYLQYDHVDFLNPLDNYDPLTDGEPTEEEYRYIIEEDLGMIDEADAVFVRWDLSVENEDTAKECGYATWVADTPYYVHNLTGEEPPLWLSEDAEAICETETDLMNAISIHHGLGL